MDLRCPDCRAPLPRGAAECPACRLALFGPAAAELWNVDVEIGRLTARRQTLIAALRAAAVATPAGTPAPGAFGGGAAPGAATGREISRFGVRNVLLTLGGLLLGIAAIVFTVISWSELSMGIRALILLSLTGVAVGVAWPLTRRGLDATAETLAVLGLLLLGLEAYAAYAYDLFGVTGVGDRWYVAATSLTITVLWAGYAAVAPLKLTRPTVVLLGQAPLPLLAYALDVPAHGMVLALLIVSALDLVVFRARGSGPRPLGAVRTVAAVVGPAVGIVATLQALSMGLSGGRPFASAGVLIAAGALLLGWAVLLDRVFAVFAGLVLAVAAACPFADSGMVADPGPLAAPRTWTPAVYAVAAVVLMAAAHALPLRLRGRAALGAGVVLGGAVLGVLPSVAIVLAGQAGRLGDIWSGSEVALPAGSFTGPGGATGARAELAADVVGAVLPATPLVLALLAVPLLVIGRRAASVPPLALAAVTLPVVADLPYGIFLVVLIATAGASACWAQFDAQVRTVAGGTALAATVLAALAALATRPATIAVLAALTVLSAMLAAAAPALRHGAAATATLTFGGFAGSAALAAGLPAYGAAFVVLAAAALGALAAVWVRGTAIDLAVGVVAAAAVAMTVQRVEPVSLALAAAGALALAISLRDDRKAVRGLGAVLLLAACWIRLADAGVTAPEAYTAPVTALALLVGVLHRRRRPETSSWTTHGGGLAITLVPSLIASWSDTGWLRPLLLGTVALAVALVGARLRLQAPLLLGGGVAVLDAGRELWPSIAFVAARLPGWLPIALAGSIILLIGATYEHRLRDLRRLRHAVARLG